MYFSNGLALFWVEENFRFIGREQIHKSQYPKKEFGIAGNAKVVEGGRNGMSYERKRHPSQEDQSQSGPRTPL